MVARKKSELNDTEVLLSNSKAYIWLERIGVILHIVAFLFGIITLIEISWFEEQEVVSIFLESLTLFVIFLILLNSILRPLFKKILIRHFLKEFWFKTRIENIFNLPISKNITIDTTKSGDELTRVDYHRIVTRDHVDISFKRVKMFKWILNIEYTSPEYFKSTFKWKIDHIFIDAGKKVMEMEVCLEDEIFEIIKKIEPNIIVPSNKFVYTIDLANKRAAWIGKNHNNTPTWFGEWNLVKKNNK